MKDLVNQQLGNYRITRLLGRGGFATVYLGEHLHLKSFAAIKVLHTNLSEQDAQQFLKEAQLLASLSHPHIVRLLDYAVQDGVAFLVMEYAARGTLRTRYPNGVRLTAKSIVPAIQQVASALQYAHDLRLMHRDVKPENLLLSGRDEVLLSDFGLALLWPPTGSMSTQTMESSPRGTVPYLAPEQLQGKPQPASDQYALGIIAYEWLGGMHPFRGSSTEIAMQHLSVLPLPLRELVPDLPPAVEEVVLRALSKNPQDRFVRVQEFADAFASASGEYLAPSSTTPYSLQAGASPRDRAGYQELIRSSSKREPIWKMPATFTSLIGREHDVATITAMLQRPEIRLLTLVGMGGIGKTRLSMQVATDLREYFADGVCFVSLAPISDPNLVIPTIAQMLEVIEDTSRPLFERLKFTLQEKVLLLVLDNFEQVSEVAPRLLDLLAACPHLKLLVTSRMPLHLSGEQRFPVPPLEIPDLKKLTLREDLSQTTSVALFVERARAVKPDFQITATNAQAIAEICVHLDGLPLTLELAAARIPLLPPQALLTRLAHRLPLLTGGARDVPTRQQTLRNTLAWSYDLLTAEEQRLFRRFAVFVGGCTLEAIEAFSTALDGEADQVLDGVTSLLEKSLLRPIGQEEETPRLVMLETVREYAREALSATTELEAARQAHATCYLALVEKAELNWGGPQEAQCFARLGQEHDNLRAAMSWLLERREAEMALRLGAAMWWFWLTGSHYKEGWNFLERALAGSEGVAVAVRAKALWAAGNLAAREGHIEMGEALCLQSLALSRQIGDRAGMRDALFHLAIVAGVKHDFTAERSRYEESLALSKETGDKHHWAWALAFLAANAFHHGEYARVYPLAHEGLMLFREMSSAPGIACSLTYLALLMVVQGDLGRAHALAEECLALVRETDTRFAEADALVLLGEVTLQQGDTTTARLLIEQSCALWRELGNEGKIAWTLSLLAKIAAVEGDYATARVLYETSLMSKQGMIRNQTILDLIPALEGLATVVAAQGQPRWAAHLWGTAETLREAHAVPLSPIDRRAYERSVATARVQLGEQAFAIAWAEGRAMTPEQALTAESSSPRSPAPVPKTPPPLIPTYPDGLTPREVEVLHLVASGLTDAQVAQRLVISRHTVNSHLKSIYSKIGVSSRSAATHYALEHKLV